MIAHDGGRQERLQPRTYTAKALWALGEGRIEQVGRFRLSSLLRPRSQWLARCTYPDRHRYSIRDKAEPSLGHCPPRTRDSLQ